MHTIPLGLRPNRWAIWAFCFTIGCFSSFACQAKNSDHFVLSGNATYDGKPIPAGELIFTPDTGRGNKGPQGKARIQNGKFTTENNGRGVVGGPHRVELRAFDGVPYEGREMKVDEGRPLFGSLVTEIDLPAESTTLVASVEMDGPKPQLVLTVSE